MSLILVNGAYVPAWVYGDTARPAIPTFVPPPKCDAGKINGVTVNDDGKSDGKVLAYDATDREIIWATGGGGRALASATLTSANAGETLTPDFDIYYVTLPTYPTFSVTLPDASLMTDRELTFITVNPFYESWFIIQGGTIQGQADATFQLAGHSSVKLMCDGTGWYITSHYA